MFCDRPLTRESSQYFRFLSFCFDSILSLGYGIDLGLLSTKTNFNVREMRQQVEHSYLDLDLDVDVDL